MARGSLQTHQSKIKYCSDIQEGAIQEPMKLILVRNMKIESERIIKRAGRMPATHSRMFQIRMRLKIYI